MDIKERAIRDPARLQALRRLGLVDAPPDPALDRLTLVAQRVLRAPVALICLVDADRQIIQSSVGLPEPFAARRETPLSHSICRHLVTTGASLAVGDARTDDRLRDHPAVTELGVAAYAASPLVTADGHVVGTLAVLDFTPRTWRPDELDLLDQLAGTVWTHIELMRARRELEQQAAALRRAASARALVEPLGAPPPHTDAWSALLDHLPDPVYLKDVDSRFTRVNVPLDAELAQANPEARAGGYVLLAVSDTGTGMSAEVKAHLFEPFFTTKDVGKGTGLGLATVYGIVHQSDGLIAVDSEPGRGTAFRIFLPRAEAPAAVTAPVSVVEAVRAGSGTVLLVEDEAGVRHLTRDVLSRYGYRVLEAANGSEALRLAAAHDGTIDLLLTDVVMPGMSGAELAEQFHTVRPAARVLFASGYADDAVIRHGVTGSVPFLQKPFEPDELVRRVREVMDSSRSPSHSPSV